MYYFCIRAEVHVYISFGDLETYSTALSNYFYIMHISKLLMATAIFVASSVPRIAVAQEAEPEPGTGQFTLSTDHSNKQSFNSGLSLLKGGITVYQIDGWDNVNNVVVERDALSSYTGDGLRPSYNYTKNLSAEKPITYILDFTGLDYVFNFDLITIQWEGGCRASDYTLSVSDNKENWTTVGSVSGVTRDNNYTYDNFSSGDNNISGKYLKINITGVFRTDYTPNLEAISIQRKTIPSFTLYDDNRVYSYNETGEVITSPEIYGNIIRANEHKYYTASVTDKYNTSLILDETVNVTVSDNKGTVTATETEAEKKKGGWKFQPNSDAVDGFVDLTFEGAGFTETRRLYIFDTDPHNTHNYISGDRFEKIETSSTKDTTPKFIDSDSDINSTGSEFTFETQTSITDPATSKKNHWVTMELDNTYTIDNISIYWTCPPDFTISVSEDGENYTTVVTEEGKVNTHQYNRYALTEPARAKYVKVESVDFHSVYGIKLGAIKLYGTNNVQPDHIEIASSKGEKIAVGDFTEIIATVYGGDGKPMDNIFINDLTADVTDGTYDSENRTWTPTIDSNTITFTATYGDMTGTLTLEALKPTTLQIVTDIKSTADDEVLKLACGKSTKLTVKVYDQYGTEMTVTPEVKLTADAEATPFDAETGTWTPTMSDNLATFTATCGYATATLDIQVLRPTSLAIYSDIDNRRPNSESKYNHGNLLCIDAEDDGADAATLYVEVYDQNGDIIDYPATINYSPAEDETLLAETEYSWNEETKKMAFTPTQQEAGTTEPYFKQFTFTAICDVIEAPAVRRFGVVNHEYLKQNYITRSHFKSFRASSVNDDTEFSKIVNKLIPEDDKFRFIEHGADFVFEPNGSGYDEVHWVIAELDRAYTLENFALYWDTTPEYYTISISEDGDEFEDVLTVNGHKQIHEWYRYSVQGPRKIRFFKIETYGLSGHNYGLKLGAIQLYGPGETQIPTSIKIVSSLGNVLAADETTDLTAEVYDQYGALIPVEKLKLDQEGYSIEWSYTEVAVTENIKDEIDTDNILHYTASQAIFDNIYGQDDTDLKFSVTYTTPDVKLESEEYTIEAFDIDHYLFDPSLHEHYENVNLRQYTADHTEIKADDNSSKNIINLFDGGKELQNSGNGYRVLPAGSSHDATSDITIKLYNPADIEAIVLRWERACPDAYTVEISPDLNDWILVAENPLSVDINPDDKDYFNRRFGVATQDEMRYIRIHTTANQTGYGLQLMDVKVYGTYKTILPTEMRLEPYVYVDYNTTVDDKPTTITHSHPNNVVFFNENGNTNDQFTEETIYLNPIFKNTEKAENPVEFGISGEKIDYDIYEIVDDDEIFITSTEAQLSGENSEIVVRNGNSEKLLALNPKTHSLRFYRAGQFRIYAGHTPATTNNSKRRAAANNTITNSTDITAVQHQSMLTSTYIPLKVSLLNTTDKNIHHKDENKAAELLMSGRTADDGGVEGSINLISQADDGNKYTYDVLIDLGNVIDIPAVEVYWEGACPENYKVSFSRSENFDEAVSQSYTTEELPIVNRVAKINRPRFDRFAVVMPTYKPKVEESASTPAMVESRADGDEEGQEPEASTSAEGSTQAVRYIKVHDIVKDSAMGDVWGAKLAEVTPYFNPETMVNIPTGIETISSEMNNADAPVEYFNLQGLRINNPAPGQIVIRRQGTTVTKIMVK